MGNAPSEPITVSSPPLAVSSSEPLHPAPKLTPELLSRALESRLLGEIFAWMPYEALLLAAQACCGWSEAVRDDDLWHHLALRDLPAAAVSRPPDTELPWSGLYREWVTSHFEEYIQKLDEEGKPRKDFMISATLIGDSGAGKTSFQTRFIDDEFNPDYTFCATIGIDFKIRMVRCLQRDVKLLLWDMLPVMERFNRISHIEMCSRHAHVVMMLYDITDREAFEKLDEQRRRVLDASRIPTPPVIALVACKCDLRGLRDGEVSREEGEALAAKWTVEAAQIGGQTDHAWSRVYYTETSSKTGEGVEVAVVRAVRAAVRSRAHPLYLGADCWGKVAAAEKEHKCNKVCNIS